MLSTESHGLVCHELTGKDVSIQAVAATMEHQILMSTFKETTTTTSVSQVA